MVRFYVRGFHARSGRHVETVIEADTAADAEASAAKRGVTAYAVDPADPSQPPPRNPRKPRIARKARNGDAQTASAGGAEAAEADTDDEAPAPTECAACERQLPQPTHICPYCGGPTAAPVRWRLLDHFDRLWHAITLITLLIMVLAALAYCAAILRG